MAGQQKTSRRGVIIAGALVLWVGVVVLGAGPNADDSLLGVKNMHVVWIALLGIMAVVGLILLVLLKPNGEYVEQEEKSKLGLVFLTALVLVLIWWRPTLFERLFTDNSEGEVGDESGEELLPQLELPDVETVAQATDLLLIAAAIAAIGGIWYLVRRRDEAEHETPTGANDQVQSALIEAMHSARTELMMGDDARTSVLNAYAMLESVLAAHDAPRYPSETPTEHVRRSLRRLRIDADPLVQLGELYEVARFSDHGISAEQAQLAAAALDRSRAELSDLT